MTSEVPPAEEQQTHRTENEQRGKQPAAPATGEAKHAAEPGMLESDAQALSRAEFKQSPPGD